MRTLLKTLSVAAVFLLTACDCDPNGANNDASVDGGEGGAGGAGGDDGGTGGAGGGSSCPAPVTCATANANCGLIGDGCSGTINCGTCTLPEVCGGGGVYSRCGGDAGCVPLTCAQQGDAGFDCGPAGDGCGHLINCGSCALPEICGGGGQPGRCGLLGTHLDGGICIPTTCLIAGAQCGLIGDGCSGTLDCGNTCTGGTACGGGGVANVCGGGNSPCVPLTCATADAGCGTIGNGCNGTLNCGTNNCVAPQVCGGGGVPNKCGGGLPCVALTCATADAGCGTVGNGCGGTINCGTTCPSGQACGAGGVPNQCGGQVTCVTKTCNDLSINCGAASNGCGQLIAGGCGTCTGAGQTCGGGGVANVCGGLPPCVPLTCSQANANCGPVADGCGTLTSNCGTCTNPDICGGAGLPSVCGSVVPDGGSLCSTPLCTHQQVCSGNPNGTTLTGVVLAPTQADAGYGQPDPIPGALVYVPNGTVLPFTDAGVTCDQCTDGVSGSPLVSATTGINGAFTLNNVPCGIDVPLVIQLGKWRRQITVSSPMCCSNTNLTGEQTRLPRKQGEGHPNDNIPLIAVVTGNADSIECVLPKIGVAMDQYSLPAGTGRVRFYKDNGANFTGGTSTAAASLFDSLAEMKKYDMIIIDCVGGEQPKSIQRRLNLQAYTAAGGRVFSSHFAYVWLYDRAVDPNNNNVLSPISFTSTATWTPQQAYPANQDGYIDITFPKGVTFAQWVQQVGAQAATSTPAVPRIRVTTVRNDFSAVIPPAQQWVSGVKPNCTTNCNIPLQYTFNTPTDAGTADQCGRVLFSDFHVTNAAGTGNWPAQCSVSAMTAQEKVFEYLIFDLSSCIAPDVPVVQNCTPSTCNSLGFNCGQAGNGCGGTLDCGPCTVAGQTCGGGGVPNHCGAPCTPRTCAQAGASCGLVGDGCGGVIDGGVIDGGAVGCGLCVGPQSCGGGGTANVCGGGQCIPRDCLSQGFHCGLQSNGCGVTQDCGTCVSPQTCGGGGVYATCGGGTCAPKTCADQGFNCGIQSNGCGVQLDCGPCIAPETCGGGGQPGVCGGGGTCRPKTCMQLGFNCGLQGDGCGQLIDGGTGPDGGAVGCGLCPPGQVCGASGPGLCGTVVCPPQSCQQLGVGCGPAGDGCGNIIQCGQCPPPQTCGGAGINGQCGTPPCLPRDCADAGADCGLVGNGCGGAMDCGLCTPPDTCGGSGKPNTCGHVG